LICESLISPSSIRLDVRCTRLNGPRRRELFVPVLFEPTQVMPEFIVGMHRAYRDSTLFGRVAELSQSVPSSCFMERRWQRTAAREVTVHVGQPRCSSLFRFPNPEPGPEILPRLAGHNFEFYPMTVGSSKWWTLSRFKRAKRPAAAASRNREVVIKKHQSSL
jgi:hypothetical protein